MTPKWNKVYSVLDGKTITTAHAMTDAEAQQWGFVGQERPTVFECADGTVFFASEALTRKAATLVVIDASGNITPYPPTNP